MKNRRTHRISIATLCALAISMLASNSFAAHNDYLTLKGVKNGKTYKAIPNQNGKFTFTNVEPGAYNLLYVCDDGNSTSTDGAKKDPPPKHIEIMSFSWGAASSVVSSNGSGSSTTGLNGNANAQNSRAFTVDAQAPTVTSNGSRVATGDVNGDGVPDNITSPISVSLTDATSSNGQLSKIVLQNITVSAACSPSGTIKPTYDIKVAK